MSNAIGLLEVQGYSVALAAMDKACKAATITIVGIDVNNPTQGDSAPIPVVVQVKFSGNISDVQIGLEVAKEEAKKYISSHDILTRLIPSAMTELLSLLSKGKVKQK
jgi:microcompartment protein CcmL/EutN